jgi:hypothetical protein
VLINPARNPSIFRRRFPIRLWYPSQHLLRQNPLPRSPFGSPRRFPKAAAVASACCGPCIGHTARRSVQGHRSEKMFGVYCDDTSNSAVRCAIPDLTRRQRPVAAGLRSSTAHRFVAPLCPKNLQVRIARCPQASGGDAKSSKIACWVWLSLGQTMRTIVGKYAGECVFRPEEVAILVAAFDECWERLQKSGVQYGSDRTMQAARERLGRKHHRNGQTWRARSRSAL